MICTGKVLKGGIVLILGPVGGSCDVFSLLTVFEWLQEHQWSLMLSPAMCTVITHRVQPQLQDRSLSTVSCLEEKLSLAQARLFRLLTLLFAHVWLLPCKARRRAPLLSLSHQYDASESTRSRSREGPETQRHRGDRSSR